MLDDLIQKLQPLINKREATLELEHGHIDISVPLPRDITEFFSKVKTLIFYPTSFTVERKDVKECIRKDGSRFIQLTATMGEDVYYFRVADGVICYGYEFGTPWDGEPYEVAKSWTELIEAQIKEAME